MDPPRKTALLKAARDVFLKKGYADTSLSDIIAIAGGSRRSIYEYFGDKQGLFEAALQSVFDGKLSALPMEKIFAAPMEEALTLLAENLLKNVLDPTHIAGFRLIVADAARHSELAALVRKIGPVAARAKLGVFLGAKLEIDNGERAARHFIALTLSDYQMRAFTDPDFSITDDEMRDHAREVSSVFLYGIGKL